MIVFLIIFIIFIITKCGGSEIIRYSNSIFNNNENINQ